MRAAAACQHFLRANDARHGPAKAEVRAFAEKLSKQAPVAMRLAKVLLNRSGDVPIDAALEMEAMAFGLVTSSEDLFEGLQAFMEKREPKFKGE